MELDLGSTEIVENEEFLVDSLCQSSGAFPPSQYRYGELSVYYWGTYCVDHSSPLSLLIACSSHLTVNIGGNSLLSFSSLSSKPKIKKKFHFFTVNNMVSSRFQRDQYALPHCNVSHCLTAADAQK